MLHHRLTLVFALFILLPAGANAASPSHAKASAHSAKTARTTKIDPAVATILKSAPSTAAYPNAAAVTLLDQSIVNLKTDGAYVEQTHEMVKVFNERGRSEADIAIPFNESSQKITHIVARTILPSGKVLPVHASDIYTKALFSDYAMYDDVKVVTFSMPGIEDGAIIDYSYTLTDSKPLMPGQYSEDWEFCDGGKPAKLSRLVISAPATLPIKAQIHNAPGLAPKVATSSNGKEKTYTWQMANLPDIDPEPMMPPLKDIIPWMQVSTANSWQSISGWYWGMAKNQMVCTPALHAQVVALTAGKTTQEDKAKALFYWVEQNVRYVAVELGQSAFKPHAAAQVYENRYGDCKDMATLLVTMLHDAGIADASDVLLGAGNTDPVEPNLPTPDAFDHCIARAVIDGKTYWFDCTAQVCGFGAIPGMDRGVNVLVVHDGGKGEFETVPPSTPSDNVNLAQAAITLHADGSAVCKNEMIDSGDPGMQLLAVFRQVKPDLMADVIRGIVSHESPNATLDDYTISNLQDRDTPFHMSYSFDAPVWAQSTGDLIIFTPTQLDGLNVSFDKPTRKYPIYSEAAVSFRSTMTIALPDGYTLLDKPSNAAISLPFRNFQRTVTVTGQTVQIDVQYDATPCQVPADQYQKIKDLAEKLRATVGQPLVLKKDGT